MGVGHRGAVHGESNRERKPAVICDCRGASRERHDCAVDGIIADECDSAKEQRYDWVSQCDSARVKPWACGLLCVFGRGPDGLRADELGGGFIRAVLAGARLLGESPPCDE